MKSLNYFNVLKEGKSNTFYLISKKQHINTLTGLTGEAEAKLYSSFTASFHTVLHVK